MSPLSTVIPLTLITIARLATAIPQSRVSAWPADPPLPSICGVLGDSPACPYGWKCQPHVTKDCAELGPDELCGFCSKIASKTSATPSTKRPLSTSSTTAYCPSGYTPDYRHICRTTSTPKLSSSSTLSCPPDHTINYRGAPDCRRTYTSTPTSSSKSTISCSSGYSADYRGAPYCRATILFTTTTTSSSVASTTRTPFYPSPGGTCPPTYTTDYRGICRPVPIATPRAAAAEPIVIIEKRVTTTETVLKCDTRRGVPKCPEEYKCKEIAKCPPFIAFCPGTCVGPRPSGRPTFIVDPPPVKATEV